MKNKVLNKINQIRKGLEFPIRSTRAGTLYGPDKYTFIIKSIEISKSRIDEKDYYTLIILGTDITRKLSLEDLKEIYEKVEEMYEEDSRAKTLKTFKAVEKYLEGDTL